MASTSAGKSPTIEVQDKRLWIGNLDERVTEFHLLKLLQKFGNIEKFDLLFHRSGPLAGQPRGYAFVTYSTLEEAVRVKTKLDGSKVGTKHISIKWAYNNEKEEENKTKPKIMIPALAGASDDKKPISTLTKIQAIEAKLKMMESTSRNEVEIEPTIKSSHSHSRESSSRHRTHRHHSHRESNNSSKPYSRPRFRPASEVIRFK